MRNRILLLARSHLSGEWFNERGARLPVAPVLFQASISAVLCGLARDGLGPFPYAVFALSVPLALTTLALLGELGPLLRTDPAAEWIGAQPVRRIELRSARVLVLLVLLTALALGSLIPAALLAPSGVGLGGRLVLILTGLLQTYFVAALLLWIQGLLGRRAEGLLVLIQTLVFCLVIVGFAAGLGRLPELARLTTAGGRLLLYPPAWFASLLPGLPGGPGAVLAWIAIGVTGVTFLLAPFPPPPAARRAGSPLTVLLRPVRALATRFWVRPHERAVFDFVYDALPAERDFVTRTYPLVAVPLAFLLLGAESGTLQGEGLFALLLFAPATYLPMLLLHVPATATPAAHWLLDSAPLDPAVEAAGARKAVAVRLLAPLYLGLGILTWLRGDAGLALRLTPVAAAAGLVVLRLTWSAYASRPPLSTAVADLGTVWDESSSGGMLVLAVGSTLLAILTWQLVEHPGLAFAILAAVALAELALPSPARRPKERAIEG